MISPCTPGFEFSVKLNTLLGISNAEVTLVKCHEELRSEWLIRIIPTQFEIPLFAFKYSQSLLGDSVSINSARVSTGIVPLSGIIELQFIASNNKFSVDVSIGKSNPYFFTSDLEFEKYLQLSMLTTIEENGGRLSAAVMSHSSEFNESTSYSEHEFIVKLVINNSADIYENSYITSRGRKFSLLSRMDLHTIEVNSRNIMGTLSRVELEELPAIISDDKASRYLLSVHSPDIPAISEVQTLYCSSQESIPSSGIFQEIEFPETFTISYRGFNGKALWIHDFISSNRTTCDSMSRYSSELTCINVNENYTTLEESLKSNPTLADSSIFLTSNSTTGRICPSLADGKGTVFATNITFQASSSEVIALISGSDGDVPPLVIHPMNISKSTLFVRETVKGQKAFVTEVQLLEIVFINEFMLNGSFYLYYANSKKTLIPIGITDEDFGRVLSKLVGVSGFAVSRSPIEIDIVTGIHSFSWTIVFPSRYGRARLLYTKSECTSAYSSSILETGYRGVIPMLVDYIILLSAPNDAIDAWYGASCLLPFANIITSRRLVAGVSPYSGNLKIRIGNDEAKLSWPFDDGLSLQSSLRSIPSLSLSTVTKVSLPTISFGTRYILDFVNASIGNISVDTSELILNSKQCAYDSNGRFINVCYFPFTQGAGGAEFSTCPTNSQGNGYCSTTYNLSVNNSWGFCKNCDLNAQTRLVVLSPFKRDHRWRGTAEQVSAVLSALHYIAPPDIRSPVSSILNNNIASDLVTIVVSNDDYTKIKSSPEVVNINLIVNLTNIAPAINFGDSNVDNLKLYLLEDSMLAINTISVRDDDYPNRVLQARGKVGVAISVTMGNLYLRYFKGLRFSSESGNKLKFMGSIQDVNRALSTLAFAPPLNWNSAQFGIAEDAVQKVSFFIAISRLFK